MNPKIRKSWAILALLMAMPLGIISARPAAARPADGAADESAIKQVVAGFSNGWNTHDAHAMCASLADDVEWTSWRGEVTHSRKEVEDQHALLFAGLYKNTQRTDTVKAIRYLGPDLVSVDNDCSMTGAKRRDHSFCRDAL